MSQPDTPAATTNAAREAAPLVTPGVVLPEWTDYNGHMNVAYYVLLFDRATDAMLDWIDLGERYRGETHCSVFVGEAHVTYERELEAGATVAIHSWITGGDDRKRFVVYHEMWVGTAAALAATNEVLCVHVDLAKRRSVLLPDRARARLKTEIAAFRAADRGARLGRAIRLEGCRPAVAGQPPR